MISKNFINIIAANDQNNQQDTWHTTNSQTRKYNKSEKKNSFDLVNNFRSFFSQNPPLTKDSKSIKFSELQDKFFHTATIKSKKRDSISICYNNLKQIIIQIAQSNFTNQQHKQFLQRIIIFLQTYFTQQDEEVWKLLTMLQMHQNIIDISTDIQDIFRQIKILIQKKNSILRKIIFEIWYSYIDQKYFDENSVYIDEQHIFRREFKEDLQTMIKFISEIIFLVFKNWFYSLEKKYNIYNKISQDLVPELLTSNANWKKIYAKTIKFLGKFQLVMSREDKTTNFFEIPNQLVFEEDQVPFARIIKIIQNFYSEYSVKKKIQSLLHLSYAFEEEILKYISRGSKEKVIKNSNFIDLDNKIAIFQYCILKSARNGIYESLEYLEMFFQEQYDKKMNTVYLIQPKVHHLITIMKGSALKLKERDLIYRKSQNQQVK